VKTYYVLFVKTQWAFSGLAILFVLTGRRRDSSSDALRIGFPALLALGAYAVIHVEGRYVGGFMALLFIAMLLFTDVERRLLQAITAVVVISLVVASCVEIIKQYGTRSSLPEQWPIASSLAANGLHEGDGVASIGTMIMNSWPRLARAYVVAEVPQDSVADFWNATPEVQRRVFEIMQRSGAKVIVGKVPAECTSAAGWTRIPGTDTLYVLVDRN
jgi:hypothetical protein